MPTPCPLCGAPVTRSAHAVAHRDGDEQMHGLDIKKCEAGHVTKKWADRPDDPWVEDDEIGQYLFKDPA